MNLFEIEKLRYIERKIGYNLHKGTGTLDRDRERFEIEGVRDRESRLYLMKQKVPSFTLRLFFSIFM